MKYTKIFVVLILLILPILSVGCGKDNPVKHNHAPEIADVIMSPSSGITKGMVVTFTCIATDADGDQLTYIWLASSGSFESNTGVSVKWTAPDSTALVDVQVLVNDGMVISQKTCEVQVGVDKSECYDFADSHWSRDEYTQWLIDSLGITADTMRYFDPVRQEWRYLEYQLPNKRNDQYYEMIGEYDQFRWGWEDYSDITKTSENRNTYLECLK
jgi:hypothetical protein